LNCLLANEIPPFFIVQSNIIAGLVFGGQVTLSAFERAIGASPDAKTVSKINRSQRIVRRRMR
jgi:N-acetylmuramic acid 6-phosphate (MurNAc-6-P) etherase